MSKARLSTLLLVFLLILAGVLPSLNVNASVSAQNMEKIYQKTRSYVYEDKCNCSQVTRLRAG